jgi:hypothetical protein
MNDYMNNLYRNGEGCEVTGFYRGVPFMGVINQIRATSGEKLNVYVELDQPISIAGRDRDSLVLDGAELARGSGSVTANLHVYF